MNQRHDFVAHRHASVSTKARGAESSNVPTEPKPKAPPAPGPAPDLVPIDPTCLSRSIQARRKIRSVIPLSRHSGRDD